MRGRKSCHPAHSRTFAHPFLVGIGWAIWAKALPAQTKRVTGVCARDASSRYRSQRQTRLTAFLRGCAKHLLSLTLLFTKMRGLPPTTTEPHASTYGPSSRVDRI